MGGDDDDYDWVNSGIFCGFILIFVTSPIIITTIIVYTWLVTGKLF